MAASQMYKKTSISHQIAFISWRRRNAKIVAVLSCVCVCVCVVCAWCDRLQRSIGRGRYVCILWSCSKTSWRTTSCSLRTKLTDICFLWTCLVRFDTRFVRYNLLCPSCMRLYFLFSPQNDPTPNFSREPYLLLDLCEDNHLFHYQLFIYLIIRLYYTPLQ